MTKPPVAYKSACWIPLNDPRGLSHFQRLGNYLITRIEWTERPTTFIVRRLDDNTLVLETDDYADVTNLILN